MSDEMKFRDEKFKEFWHSWKGTAKENDEHFKAEIYSSWCHSWSRAIASQPKGREFWISGFKFGGDESCSQNVTVELTPRHGAIHVREVLASQAADEGKVGWGPLPTTEHYQEEDPRDARIAELEAANENLKMLIRRVYRKLKIARPGSAIDLLDEAFDLWKGSILRGSDGGGG